MLSGVHGGVECRFYFDPVEGDLLAIEFFADESSDPCEVYFSEFRQTGGRLVPTRIAVNFGDKPYAVFKIDEFRVERRKGGE